MTPRLEAGAIQLELMERQEMQYRFDGHEAEAERVLAARLRLRSELLAEPDGTEPEAKAAGVGA